MNHFDEIYKREIEHEQYYAHVKGDKGGETYMGIARNINPDWEGWRVIDEYKSIKGEIAHNYKIESITLDSMVNKFYLEFWCKNGIDLINDFSLQYIIFDWCVNSGHWGARKVQQIVGVKIDGFIGNDTAKAINNRPPEHLFNIIKYARINYYIAISKKDQNHKFLHGWLNRINSINYEKIDN